MLPCNGCEPLLFFSFETSCRTALSLEFTMGRETFPQRVEDEAE
jgi:hypothetical protein